MPPAKLLKLAVNAADIFLTVQRVAEPIVKLYNKFTGRFDNVFKSFFSTFDDLDLLDGISVTSTPGSILNIDVDLKGKTVDVFMNYISGLLGKAWIANQNNPNILGLDISNDIRLSFYPTATSTGGPTIAVVIDGVQAIKIRLQ